LDFYLDFFKIWRIWAILAMKNPLYIFSGRNLAKFRPTKKKTPTCPGPAGVQKVVLLGVGAGDSLIEQTEPLKPISIWTMSPQQSSL
jgi:hypothetical protein